MESKGMYFNGSFHVTGSRKMRGMLGENFSIGKKNPANLSDLIVGFSISAGDFAMESSTYTEEEIRQQYSTAVERMLKIVEGWK